MKKINIVTAGNITIDDIVLPDGKTQMGVCGGDVLYSALGASFWMENVGMLTRTGNDFPKENLERCVKKNIDIDGAKVYEGESVRNWVIYEYDGRRYFIYRTDPGQLDYLSPLPEDIPDNYLDAECFFLAAMPVEKQMKLAVYLKDRGKTVILDPYEEDASNNKEQLAGALKFTDIFMPSEEEERRFFGNLDHETNIRKFANYGPGIVVIKLGDKGSVVYKKEEDKIYRIPVYSTKAVDVTGAGDAFGGGFTAGFFITKDPVLSAMYGAVSASFAIEDFGSLHLFERFKDEAIERLEKLKQIVAGGM